MFFQEKVKKKTIVYVIYNPSGGHDKLLNAGPQFLRRIVSLSFARDRIEQGRVIRVFDDLNLLLVICYSSVGHDELRNIPPSV